MSRVSRDGETVHYVYDGVLGHTWVSASTPAWRRVRDRLAGALQRAGAQDAVDSNEYVRRQVLRNIAQVRRRDVAIAYVTQLGIMGLHDLAAELEAQFVLTGRTTGERPD